MSHSVGTLDVSTVPVICHHGTIQAKGDVTVTVSGLIDGICPPGEAFTLRILGEQGVGLLQVQGSLASVGDQLGGNHSDGDG